MFENIYTTKMSASRKTLQARFQKIRSKKPRFSRLTALVLSAALAIACLTATCVLAAVGNEEKNFFVDGKGYAIKLILVENVLATHTDNYYVPLRATFEALGYTVAYDVDKAKYQRLMDRHYTFPAYDALVYYEMKDDAGETYINDFNSFAWRKNFVTNSADYYIYGATNRMNKQMPIIEMTKGNKTEYCQIGSCEYSVGYTIAPVLIDGVAYVPLRFVATAVGGMDNVKWDDAKHDTYFEGALTFDEQTKTVTVNLS